MENINLKALVGILGVNEHTLRAWERRYGAIRPSRSSSGRRVYSSKDVERLKLLVALVNKNYAIGNIANLPNNKLQILIQENQGVPAEKRLTVREDTLVEETLKSIVDPLKKFQLSHVQHALQSAFYEVSKKTFIEKLIMPLMHEVGVLVMEDKITIAQEHILSAMLRDQLGQIFQSLHPFDRALSHHSKTYVFTTREGDLHEFGILTAAITCALERRNTFYLGPNMPATDLVNACEDFAPDFLVLGLQKLPVEKEFVSTQKYLTTLDELLPKKVALILGGRDLDVARNVVFSRKVYFIESVTDFRKLIEIEG